MTSPLSVAAKCFLLGALCFFSAHVRSQTFSNLIDCDSLVDFGTGIALNSDGTYLVINGGLNLRTRHNDFTAAVVGRNGKTILINNHLRFPDASLFTVGSRASYGKLARAGNSSYVVPLTIENLLVPVRRPRMGCMVVSSQADTLKTLLFTDTTQYFEQANDACFDQHNNRYIVGGLVAPKPPRDSFGNARGLLVISDNLGNILVRKEFENKAPIPPLPPNGVLCRINSVEALPDGRILIGATNGNIDSKIGERPGPYQTEQYDYYHMRPWFIITDAAGNILKDTMYDGRYTGQGNVYTDKLGGYLHWGALDSFLHPNPTHFSNLPGYVAQLDTNFRPLWLHWFGSLTQKIYVIKTIQLGDGDYLAIGSCSMASSWHGWLARLSRSGQVKWERTYTVDPSSAPYLVDGKERADGSVVLTGMARNSANPAWRQQDIWMLAIDSAGCELPECGPITTNVPLTVQKAALSIYPNPTSGQLNVRSATAGTLTLYDMRGIELSSHDVAIGTTTLRLPPSQAPGIFIGRFRNAQNGEIKSIRLVYQP